MRRRLAEVSTLPRVRKCGKVSMLEGGAVQLRYNPHCGRAAYGGLTTCGSVWACPACAAKIALERIAELTHLLKWNAGRGGSVALLTLTARHNKGQRLRDLRRALLRALLRAWKNITGGRAWKTTRKEVGCDGHVRATEVTYSEKNGWHVHFHCLLIFDHDVDVFETYRLADAIWRAWERGLARNGLTAVREHALDLRIGEDALENLGGYLNKLAFESAGGRWKSGHVGGRTPFELLRSVCEQVNAAGGVQRGAAGETVIHAADYPLWAEWERDSRNMRQLCWSKGLKNACGVRERDDEEIAAEEQAGETLTTLSGATWRSIYPVAERLLEVAESGGKEGALAFLAERNKGPMPLAEPDHDGAAAEVERLQHRVPPTPPPRDVPPDDVQRRYDRAWGR